jgi:LCP family protein required for cell wall assembly
VTAFATPDLTAQLTPTPVPTAVLTKDTIHILLIGADTGTYAPDQNTDVLIVVAINRKTKQVSLLSIPRDLWVYIPTVGYSRINTAHRYGARRKYPGGGPALLIRTIQENLGIPIDHWVRVDYQGFAGAVDKLGGIDMLVPCQTNLRYKPPNSATEQEMILEPGFYHMDGATSLRYVRTRRGESDFDRARRQQQFLRAIWDQFKSPDIVTKLPGLWWATKAYFKTDLNLGDILALAPTVLDLQRQNIRSRYIGRSETQDWTTPEGWAVLLPITDKIQQVVANLDAPQPAADAAVSESARIQVSNGTSRAYLAEIAADQLRWNGFTIAGTGPADKTDYAKTQIVVFQDRPETLARLVQQFKVSSENVIHQPDPAQPADLQVILGEDYDPCP